jgi:hypothetical protein
MSAQGKFGNLRGNYVRPLLRKLIQFCFLSSACFLFIAGLARAADDDWMFDPNHVWSETDFDQLAKPATTPLSPGTEVTTQNWQQYKDYMSLGMRTAFIGTRFFKIQPGWKIIMGPTIPIALPKLFQAATEKYAGTASIVPAPEIGPTAVTIKGYQGGVPFPNPKEPDLGTKIEYNAWFSYMPVTTHINADAWLVDRFHDRSPLIVDAVIGRASFAADPGFPETNPVLSDVFKYTYDEVVLPEEAKYSGVLDIWHRDPVTFTDLFAYVPALRRVLRLSPAAVCAPVVGSDTLNDDNCTNIGNCQQVPLFNVKFLGEKKAIFMLHMVPEALMGVEANLMPLQKYFYTSSEDIAAAGFGLPKPSAGTWEVRDVYMIRLRRIPSLQKGYCYGSRLFYVDKDTWHNINAEMWDAQQKYWKIEFWQFSQIPIPETNGDTYFADNLFGTWMDFQNFHATGAALVHSEINKLAGKYQDTVRYATPGGLQQINQ